MIEVHDLWKKFGRHDALRGLRFNVPEGSAYALIGASGAGKTTTIKVLMNIIEPTRGRATVLARIHARSGRASCAALVTSPKTRTCLRNSRSRSIWRISGLSTRVGTQIWKPPSNTSSAFRAIAGLATCRMACA